MDNVNVYRSTLSERIFASIHQINNEKPKWGVILAVLICNILNKLPFSLYILFFLQIFIFKILLPGLILSYGVIGTFRKESGRPISELLITPCTFCATWILADPWLYDAADNRNLLSRYLSFIGAVLCFLGIISNSWNENIFYHGFFYGILGGLGTSLVLSQFNYVAEDVYQSNMNKIKRISFYGQAIGQSILPYIYMVIFYFYGHSMGYLLLSGLALQILPLAIFLKSFHSEMNRKTNNLSFTYKRAYSLFDDDTSISSNINEVPLVDLSKKSWRSPSDENLLMFNNETHFMEDEYQLSENEYLPEEEKYKVFRGVQILPQIIEENEDTEDDEDKKDGVDEENNENRKATLLEKSINRLSAISNQLDDIITISDNSNTNTDERTRKTQYTEDENSKNMTGIEKNVEIEHIPVVESKTIRLSKTICCCSHYRYHRVTRCLSNIPEYIQETFIFPLKLSLKTWQFYPVLLLRISTSCLFFSCSSFIILLNFSKESQLSLSSTTFLISLHGISWLSFLILSPWLAGLKKYKYKIVSAFGSTLSSFGLFLIYEFNLMEIIILGTMLIGIGYGALSISCQETARDFIGLRKWSKLKGTLESLSGIIIMGIGIWLSYLLTSKNGVSHCFQFLASILFLCGIFWIIVVFIETIRQHDHKDHVIWPHV